MTTTGDNILDTALSKVWVCLAFSVMNLLIL